MLNRTLLTFRLTICLVILAQIAYAQPVNDDPCGAVILIIQNGSICIPANPQSWTDATATTGFDNPTCASYTTGDIWYTFTIAEPSNIFVTTTAGNGPNLINDGGMELYYNAGGCSGTFIPVMCDDDAGVGSMPQITIPALTAGTYYIRFWDYNDETSGDIGGICLAADPVSANAPYDDPCTALALNVSNGDQCTPDNPMSWTGATATSSVASPTCGSYKTGDLWFSFSLTDTSDIYITTTAGIGPGAITDAALALYTGDICNGNFAEIACQNNQGPDLMPALIQSTILPGTYYIRFWDVTDSLSGNFGGICVAASPTIVTPTINDDPCGATVLNTIADTSCVPSNPQVWSNATSTIGFDIPPCGSYTRGDVWFQFELNEASDIFITTVGGVGAGAITDGAMTLYMAGDCSDEMIYLFCDDDSGEGSMPQIRQYAMPAGKYFIRFWDYENKVTGNIGGICVAAVPTISTVVNDNCFNPMAFPPLPVDGACASVAVNTIGATGLPVPLCGAIADDDVWYSFVVPAGITQVAYSVTKNGSLYDAGKRLYDIACDDHSLGCMHDAEGLLTDLVSGNTYYIRTCAADEDEDGAQYEICLRALLPPVNDDPCGAITLIPHENTTNCIPEDPISWEFASASDVPDPGCGQYSTGDVWFKFELSYRADVTIRSTAGTGLHAITDGAMALYHQVSDCNELEKIICVDDSSTTVLMPYLHLFALLPGTYYIRFWEYHGAISGDLGGICIATVPTISVLENDVCEGAFAFPTVPTDGSCASVEINTAQATGDIQLNLIGYNDDDLWYSFVVPAGVHNLLYDVTTNSGNIQHIVCLYDQCGYDIQPIQCTDFNLNENGRFENLIEGATYYIRTYTDEVNVKSDYTICLRTFPEPPVNDECVNAIPFPAIAADGTCTTIPINTTWATNSGNYTCGGGSADIWYSFVVPDGVTDIVGEFISIGRYDNEGFEVFEGECDNLVSVFCVDDRDFQSSRIDGLTPGATYYIRVFTSDHRLFEFDLCLRAAYPGPANDHCDGAIPFPQLPADGSCAMMTADLKGASLDGPHDCEFVDGFDVWYSFVMPMDHEGIIVSVGNPSQSASVGVTIYGGDCDEPVYVGCMVDRSVNFSGLIGGETYLVRAFTYFANVEITFDICIALAPDPPANAECAGALPFPTIPVNGDWVGIEGSTVSGTDSDLDDCNGNGNDDVWYSFVVPDGVTELLFRWSGDDYPTFEIFDGDCDNLIFLECYGTSNSSGAIANLVPGQTYLMRVYDPGEFEFTEFTAQLSVPQPILNDHCVDAIAFPTIPIDGSCASVKTELALATNSGDAYCDGSLAPDTWFTFRVPDGYTGVIITTQVDYGYTPVVQIFSGECNALVSERCEYFPEYAVIPGLEGGQTYFMEIQEYGGASGATICLSVQPLPPLNDDCTGAFSITTPQGLFVDPGPQTTLGATLNDLGPCFPFGGENPYDVWYSMTTDADGGDATIRLDFIEPPLGESDFTSMVLGAFEGDCDQLELLGCIESAFGISSYEDTFIIMELHALAPATTYYLRAFPSFHYTAVNFTLFAEGTALSPSVGVYNPDDDQDNFEITRIFPSPANSQIGIEFKTNSQEKVRLWITDILGHIVLQKELMSRQGANRTSEIIDALAPGVYILNLEHNGVVSEGKRFVKSSD